MHILLINNLKNTHLAKFIFAYLLKMMLNWLNETVLQDKEILSKRANFGSLWYKVRNTRKCSPRNTVYYTRMSPTLISICVLTRSCQARWNSIWWNVSSLSTTFEFCQQGNGIYVQLYYLPQIEAIDGFFKCFLWF